MQALPYFISALFAALSGAQVPDAHTATPSAEAVIQRPSGLKLIAFDGLRELGSVASRVGMLAQRLDDTLEVGADGVPSRCTLSRKFRSQLVTKQLCDVLMRRMRFEPARDAWGTPVNGTHTGRINFYMPIKPDR
ncbi:MAG: hypothetical protein ACKO1N_09585 [Erythrobacter sp.]